MPMNEIAIISVPTMDTTRIHSSTYLAIEVIIPVTSLAERAIIALLSKFKARPAKRQTTDELVDAITVAALAFEACTANLQIDTYFLFIAAHCVAWSVNDC